MKLIIIAAIAHNRVISNNGKLPWHIPEDLARFKLLTTSRTILMGRKTFESLGRKLPDRRNVVLSSKPIENVETYTSLTLALKALKEEAQVFVIGGASVFTKALEIADELRLTLIDKDVAGDTYFPQYEEFLQKNFQLINEERHQDFSFLDYIRKK